MPLSIREGPGTAAGPPATLNMVLWQRQISLSAIQLLMIILTGPRDTYVRCPDRPARLSAIPSRPLVPHKLMLS